MAKKKASPEEIIFVKAIIDVLLIIVLLALVLFPLYIISKAILGGLIIAVVAILNFGNWLTGVVNYIALWPLIRSLLNRLSQLKQSYIAKPTEFYIIYHFKRSDPSHEVVINIIKPALENTYHCVVIPTPWNRSEDLRLELRNAGPTSHIFFVLSNEFFNELDKSERLWSLTKEVLINELLSIANSNEENRRGSAIIVERSVREVDLRARSLASETLYEELDAGQVDVAMNKVRGFVPPAYRRYKKIPIQSTYQTTLDPAEMRQSKVLPQVPPPPSVAVESLWEVPFDSNPHFIDRDDQNNLSSVLGKLTGENTNVLVLYGLNGVGKTEIVRAYAYEYGPRNEERKKSFQYYWVMWLDASLTLDKGCRNLNDKLYKHSLEYQGIANQEDNNELNRLYTWLSTWEQELPQGKKWLLIVDKCTKHDFESAKNKLQGFARGHIIYTMRENPGVGDYIDHQVKEMNEEDGIRLLCSCAKKEPDPEEEEQVRAVVQELGGNPLAIANAGAYITSNKIGFRDYLRRYENEKRRILSDPLGNPYIGADKLEVSVATTFRLSFMKIRGDRRGTEELLLLCAFLGFSKIPIEIVTLMPLRSGNAAFLIGSEALDNARRKLYDLSFIEGDQDKFIRLEKIVRDVIRADFYPNATRPLKGKAKRWYRNSTVYAVSTAFLQVLCGMNTQDYLFLIRKFGCANLGDLYLPHVFECYDKHIQEMKSDHAVTLDAVLLLHSAGNFLREYPQFEKTFSMSSLDLLEEARTMREINVVDLANQSVSDTTYPDLPTCLNSLAELYYEQFQNGDAQSLKLAEDCLCKASAIFANRQKQQQESSDPRNIDEPAVRNNLGRVLDDNGKYEEAWKEFVIASRMRKRTLVSSGATGLNRTALLLNQAAIFNNLAGIYVKFGDQEMEKAEKAHDEHRHTEAEEIKRASRQQYRIAEKLYDNALNRVLKEASQVLTQEPDSPERDFQLKVACERQRRLYEFQLKTNKATLYVCQGDESRYEEAREIYRDVNDKLEEMIKQVRQKEGYVPCDLYLQLAVQWNNLLELYRIQREFDDVKLCYKKVHEYYTNYTGRIGQELGHRHLIRFVIRDNDDELATRTKVMNRQELKEYQAYRNEYLGVVIGE